MIKVNPQPYCWFMMPPQPVLFCKSQVLYFISSAKKVFYLLLFVWLPAGLRKNHQANICHETCWSTRKEPKSFRPIGSTFATTCMFCSHEPWRRPALCRVTWFLYEGLGRLPRSVIEDVQSQCTRKWGRKRSYQFSEGNEDVASAAGTNSLAFIISELERCI